MVGWQNQGRLPDNDGDPDAVRRLALLGGAAGSVLLSRLHWLSRQGRVAGFAFGASWHVTPAWLVPHEVPAVATSNHGGTLRTSRLLAPAASHSPHVRSVEDRDRLGGGRRERKQRRGRFLIYGQRALKDHGLVDDVAAPEVADRDDQTRLTVAIAKIELARIRPSAAMPSLGMCPEPAPIKPDNFIQRARHGDDALPQSVWPAPTGRPHQYQIRRTYNSGPIIADEQRHKRYKTLGFSKYCRKSS
jgi:hypothetical protein